MYDSMRSFASGWVGRWGGDEIIIRMVDFPMPWATGLGDEKRGGAVSDEHEQVWDGRMDGGKRPG